MNATGRPQSCVVSGPAYTDGATLSTFTVNDCVALSPLRSVTVSWPSYTPSSAKARCGVGPNDFVPSEKSQTYEPIGHCECTDAENAIGVPSDPANGPNGSIV